MSDEGSWAKYGSLPNSFGRKFRIDLVQKTIYVYRIYIYIVFIWYLYGTFMVCVWYANSMYMVCICICMWYVYGTVDIWPNMGDVYIYYQRKFVISLMIVGRAFETFAYIFGRVLRFTDDPWQSICDFYIYAWRNFVVFLMIFGRALVTFAYMFGWT